MIISAALALSAQALSNSSNPQLYSRTLISSVLNIPEVDVYAKPQQRLTLSQESDLQQKITRLNSGEPFDYVVGYSVFHGRHFKVSSDVLIPRPETEELVQLVLDSPLFVSHCQVLEIGVGSGCVSVTLLAEAQKRHLQGVSLVGIDKSPEALEITRENFTSLLSLRLDKIARPAGYADTQAQVRLLNLEALSLAPDTAPDILISNPPYITSKEMIGLDKSVLEYEPRLALEGGVDGLEVYRDIANYILQLERKPALFLEISPTIAAGVKELFGKIYPDVEIKLDLFGKQRFLVATARQ